ncbi:MAG TPA: response regulator transcription factor [Synergistales bacterium]|jgi:DNA-binding NarL/FixJ family response regulator|nr:response regulator transcription factor [Synergistales bacterium]
MLRILLADDHPLTRSGLAAWLEAEEGVELVGQAADGESAWTMLLETQPDLALLDIEMPNGSGIEIAERIMKRKLPTNVLMLTAYSAQQYVMASVRAGAKGFILKSAPFDQLRQAIADTSRGIFYLDPSVSLVSDEAPAEELSEREKEVLILTAQGLPSSETARLLSITKRTVAAHLTSIYAKLGAKNKTEAILLALKRGVVLLDQLRFIDGKGESL